jgi:hypothetical protein
MNDDLFTHGIEGLQFVPVELWLKSFPEVL